MAVFLALIIPLPFTIKRKLFAFISESPIIAKLQYGLKVWLIPDIEIDWAYLIGNLDYIHLHPHSVH